MLRIATLSLALLAGSAALPARAQKALREVPANSLPNELKLNLPSLVLKSFSLQYERGFSPRFSGALGLRLGPEAALPFRERLKRTYTDAGDTTLQRVFGSLRTRNFALTPEVRCYFSGTTAHGFYLAAFGRYSTTGLSADFTTPDDAFASRQRPVQVTGTYRSAGLGLMAGVKWRLRTRWVLDWWLAGPMYTGGTLDLDVRTDMTTLSAADKESLRQDIARGISIGGKELKGEPRFRNDGLDVSGEASMLQVRTGLALGIAF